MEDHTCCEESLRKSLLLCLKCVYMLVLCLVNHGWVFVRHAVLLLPNLGKSSAVWCKHISVMNYSNKSAVISMLHSFIGATLVACSAVEQSKCRFVRPEK